MQQQHASSMMNRDEVREVKRLARQVVIHAVGSRFPCHLCYPKPIEALHHTPILPICTSVAYRKQKLCFLLFGYFLPSPPLSLFPSTFSAVSSSLQPERAVADLRAVFRQHFNGGCTSERASPARRLRQTGTTATIKVDGYRDCM